MALLWAAVLLPLWGTRSAEEVVVSRYRYTGQREEEAIGLYYYGARWYDAGRGRFIQPDTIVPRPSDPQNLDRYAYCYNNPIRYNDPTGHIGDPSRDHGIEGPLSYYHLSSQAEFREDWFHERSWIQYVEGQLQQYELVQPSELAYHVYIWAADRGRNDVLTILPQPVGSPSRSWPGSYLPGFSRPPGATLEARASEPVPYGPEEPQKRLQVSVRCDPNWGGIAKDLGGIGLDVASAAYPPAAPFFQTVGAALDASSVADSTEALMEQPDDFGRWMDTGWGLWTVSERGNPIPFAGDTVSLIFNLNLDVNVSRQYAP